MENPKTLRERAEEYAELETIRTGTILIGHTNLFFSGRELAIFRAGCNTGYYAGFLEGAREAWRAACESKVFRNDGSPSMTRSFNDWLATLMEEGK